MWVSLGAGRGSLVGRLDSRAFGDKAGRFGSLDQSGQGLLGLFSVVRPQAKDKDYAEVGTRPSVAAGLLLGMAEQADPLAEVKAPLQKRLKEIEADEKNAEKLRQDIAERQAKLANLATAAQEAKKLRRALAVLDGPPALSR